MIQDHIWNSEPQVGEIMGNIFSSMGGKHMLELGFFRGFTSSILRKHLGTGQLDMVDITNEHLISPFKEEIENDIRVSIYINDSISALQQFVAEDRVYDLIFIDTTHEYLQTLKEFRLCDKLIRKDGFICLHDCHSHVGVSEFINQLDPSAFADGTGYELITIPTTNNNGLALVKCSRGK